MLEVQCRLYLLLKQHFDLIEEIFSSKNISLDDDIEMMSI